MLAPIAVDATKDGFLIVHKTTSLHFEKLVLQPILFGDLVLKEHAVDRKASHVRGCAVDEVCEDVAEQLVVQNTLIARLPVGKDVRAAATLMLRQSRESHLYGTALNEQRLLDVLAFLHYDTVDLVGEIHPRLETPIQAKDK